MVRPDRGAAVREVADRARHRGPLTGRVVAVFRKAAYLRIGGDLVAVVSPSVPSGPLHLRCDVLPPAREGEPVLCDGSRIAARTWAVRCDGPTWEGALPAILPRLRDDVALPAEDGTEAGPATGAGIGGRIRDALSAGDLEQVAGVLGGRGPGLTPAGDDVLAGLLLTARALWGPAAEARLGATAASVATTAPAAAFLRWAARGQCVAPAHDWLCAVAARADAVPPTPQARTPSSPTPAVRDAERRLAAVGASSGRCLLAGMRAGLAQLPRVETQIAWAGAGPGL